MQRPHAGRHELPHCKSLPLYPVACWLGEDLQEQLLRAYEVAATSGKEDPLQLRLIEKKAEETWMSAYRKPMNALMSEVM